MLGSSIILFVNGTQVASASDSTFKSGKIGLMAGDRDPGGADILFKNFYVYKP